ncbi:MAG: MotA/TolQ/ExbB proton channel family protein [Geminicoccaceae bacterium]
MFIRFPKISADHFALDFIADTLRVMTMSMDDPYQVEECMQRQLRKHHGELHARAAAIQTVADSMPALGIVAAVLGVVKTMGAVDQPVTILGGMIGGALVGTFLGVYLAYGFIGPIAAKMNQTYEEDAQFRTPSSATAWSPTCTAIRRRSWSSSRARRADHAPAQLPLTSIRCWAACRPTRSRHGRPAAGRERGRS